MFCFICSANEHLTSVTQYDDPKLSSLVELPQRAEPTFDWRQGAGVTRLVGVAVKKTQPSQRAKKKKRNKIKMQQSPPAGVTNDSHVVTSLEIHLHVSVFL